MNTISFWYPKAAHFTGYISTLQSNKNDITSNLKIDSSGQVRTYYNENAFNYQSNIPTVANITETGDPWITFNLTNEKSFYLTHYELQQRNDAISNFHHKWVFEGSLNGSYWKVLDTQNIDKSDSYFKPKAERIFPVIKGNFNAFRIRSLVHGILVVQKIEIYGYLCNESSLCQLNFLYFQTQHSTISLEHLMYTLFVLFVM